MATTAGSNTSMTSVNQSVINKFTPTEIVDRRSKGLCFMCAEKFVPGHREACKHLFCIELLDDEEEEGEPTISLRP
jgi:hypothetical protein